MKLLLPLLTLSAFIWLATLKPNDGSYDVAEIEKLNQLAVQEDDYLTQLEVKLWHK